MKKGAELFKKLFQSDKAMKDVLNYIISLIIILSVSLLVYNMAVTPKENGKVVMDRDSQTIDEENLYYDDERRFCDMLSRMKGVGEVSVMITYEAADQTDTGVQGVMIVAQGAGDVVVKNHLTDAAQAVFGLPANRVTVLESK